MEHNADIAPVIASSVALVFIAILASTAFLNLVIKLRRNGKNGYNEGQKLYEDEDGIATEESQKEYSATSPRYFLLASCAMGTLIAIAGSILSTRYPNKGPFVECWITFGSWTILVFLALNLFLERQSIRRYNLGIQAAVAFSILLCANCVEFASRSSSARLSRPTLVFSVIQLFAALISLLSCLSFPRRPSVSYKGQTVDKQYTVSALNQWTWTWAGEYLALARVNGLSLEDVPKLHLRVRSSYLHAYFSAMKQKPQLWSTLVISHYWEILVQSLISIAQGVVQFGPQLAMYKLLELLERHGDASGLAQAWAWVFALGFLSLLASWAETWVHWIVLARLGSPIRTELSALIFGKAMRRKDVKSVRISKKSDGVVPNEAITADEDVQKSRQSIINLVAVDAKRIADFATFHFVFAQTASKLTTSIVFLIRLIGWKSLLAGMAVSVLVTPINIYASKCYTKAQTGLMAARDQKMVVVTEALQGIRQIKFSAFERQWERKIGEKRMEELAMQRRSFMWEAVLIAIWILGPVMLSAVSLITYSLLHGTLLPSVAFTTITIFNQIEAVLAIIPELTAEGLEAWVSARRIGDYLNGPEKQEYIIPSEEIMFENASVAWPSDSEEEEPDRFVLRNINIRLPKKELTVVSGPTGAGKSLLLASILGEAELMSGKIRVPKAPLVEARHDPQANKSDWIIDSAIAYVAQTPWIENASIKDNILFDLPHDAGRYKEVLSSCALIKDLEILPDGEMTDIGANGINLSGGQRWRVSFARALYSRAGILVLDDIFSAVDAHVGRQLFEEALTGTLGIGRTRILVTHHLDLCLPKTKYTILLGEGTVEHAGFVDDLRQTGIVGKILQPEEETGRNKPMSKEELRIRSERNGELLCKELSQTTETDGNGEVYVQTEQPKKFTVDEKRETGAIKFGIYKEYLKTSGGWWFWILVLTMFITHQGLVLGRSWWISLWTRSYSQESGSFLMRQALSSRLNSPPTALDHMIHTQQKPDLRFYLGIYFGISVLICIFGTLRYLTVLLGSLRASRILFEKLTYTILRAPLRWLDTVPVGRILNRFSADFGVVDSRMGVDFGFLMYQGMQLFGIIVAGLFVSPYMLLASIFLTILCLFIATRFLHGARELKRLESNTKSPVFEQFRSALIGIGTIRSFGKASLYVERMFDRIDDHAKVYWYLWLMNRWLALRLNLSGAAFATLISAVIVSSKSIDASIAGFALSFTLQYSSAVTWTIRQYSSVELGMNATERIVEYSRIPIEDQYGRDAQPGAENTTMEHTVPAAWPVEGRLDIEGLVVGYDPDLPPVLRGLSFKVTKNQRVGVVGRTGAGKSSLTLALFRFLEAREGSIRIDGIDISKIGLHDLRSRLAIIPQDPVLFSGTVRSNLDPFDDHTEADLYDAMERVQLIRSSINGSGTAIPATLSETNINIFKSLSSRISEGGLNLSQGQRQLLCLARAIVSRPKIMILDEATSAVDMATDLLIQRSIREEFKDSTLIVIAHRLSTIADFDKILVMSDGKAVEFDTPRNLLEERGMFWGMVGQSGEKNSLERIILGEVDALDHSDTPLIFDGGEADYDENKTRRLEHVESRSPSNVHSQRKVKDGLTQSALRMVKKPLSSLDAPISPPRVKYPKHSSARTEKPVSRSVSHDEHESTPRLTGIEAEEVSITDHLTAVSEQLKRVKKTMPGTFLSIEGFVDLYKRNQHKYGRHFVIHQHDHPIAGVHYDLRLQISDTSSISFAIMYGLPGNPNSKRLNRNATETRVHNLWNHLIETGSPSTGSLLIWDIGEYSILPYRPPAKETDDEFSSDSNRTKDTTPLARSECEKLHFAFRDRKIRIRLHGTRLPSNYTISIRLQASNNRTVQPKQSARKRRRVACGKSMEAIDINPSSSEVEEDHESLNDKVLDSKIQLDTDASVIQRELAEQEDEKIRLTNAYPGATNSINSIYQRTWYLSMDRQASGFVPQKHKNGTREWVQQQEGGSSLGFEPFFVRGKEIERSVVTGRLAEEVMSDEGVKGYVGRKGWRPVLE